MKRWILGLVLLCLPGTAPAETPFQFAAPGLRAPDDPNVNGVRFTVLYGRNSSVRGIDLGFVSLSETASLSGFGAVFGVGRVTGSTNGFASALVNVHGGTDRGVNAAFVNHINTLQHGANIGFVNIADGYTRVDLGGLNVSERSTVQLGFVNVTRRIRGVQLGFVNAAENGFLPVFPFFNIPKD